VLLRLEEVEERLADLGAGHHFNSKLKNAKCKNRIAAKKRRERKGFFRDKAGRLAESGGARRVGSFEKAGAFTARPGVTPAQHLFLPV
jgi:hypothetical protein